MRTSVEPSKIGPDAIGLSRRTFLKGIAATGVLAAGTSTLAGLTTAAEAQAEEDKIVQGICSGNCQGCCPLALHVRDDKIVEVTWGDFPDEHRRRACARGLSHVSRIYSDHRVKYPMRRKEGTSRGAGEWERISWDEAVETVTSTWKHLQAEYGDQSVAFIDGTGNLCVMDGVIPGYLSLLRNGIKATDIDFAIDWGNGIPLGWILGQVGMNCGANEPTDCVNSKSIFLWGSNITGANVHDWHIICDAMENGTRLVVVDPNFTWAASKADLWVPIRPGTDGALFLGIMNLAFEQGQTDIDYLRQYSCAPFLVSSQTQKFLRRSDLDPATYAGDEADSVLVVDAATGRLVPFAECDKPLMEGAFEFDGVSCSTAYTLLKARCAEYPVSRVAEITDLSEDIIRQVASYCFEKPVTHRLGFGLQAYMNGVETVQAGFTMAVLLGNLGYNGASFGGWYDGPMAGINFGYVFMPGPSPSPDISDLVLPEVLATDTYLGKYHPIKSLLCISINPINTANDTNAYIRDVIDKLEFLVVIDSEMTDTAQYADVILPCTQWFEHEDMLLSGTTGYVLFSNKAIEPMYECLPDSEIYRRLGRAMGMPDMFLPDDETFLRNMVATPFFESIGCTYDTLKAKGAIRFYEDDPHVYQSDRVYLTPSGRAEFYVEQWAQRMPNPLPLPEHANHLPFFRPADESYWEGDLAKKYPLVLLSERNRFGVHSQWSHTPWIRELDPEPRIKVNPVDAAARGVADGDYIEVFNDRGHAVARCNISPGVRPGVMVYPKGYQTDQFKVGSWSELTNAHYDPICVNRSFMDNRADFRLWTE